MNKVAHKVAPFELKAWRESMGYTVEAACHELGTLQDDFLHWEDYPDNIPRYIKLACAALALGIKPD